MSDNHDLLNDKDVCSNKDAVARRNGCQIIPKKRYT